MVRIDITLKATSDLNGIEKFIGHDNPKRAITYKTELLEKFIDTVSLFPLSCPQHRKRKNVRKFVYGEYNVYYSFNEREKTVSILHVYHRSQLINSLLFF